jgi:hypothetical protein
MGDTNANVTPVGEVAFKKKFSSDWFTDFVRQRLGLRREDLSRDGYLLSSSLHDLYDSQ